MKKEELITNIQSAFKNVKLEDGIGLWEAQGIDDYANAETILELRKKDERQNWNNIPSKDISLCAISLSFFDAKGMRFCLPKFLLFDISEIKTREEEITYSVDLLFTLGHKLSEEYQIKRFSLFDQQQKECVIYYLKYKLEILNKRHGEYSEKFGSSINTLYEDPEYISLLKILKEWEELLKA